MKLKHTFYLLVLLAIVSACSNEKEQKESHDSKDKTSGEALFTSLPPTTTNILFRNQINESATNNYFSYNYFYNGAGVAAGDINNDGKIDLYFSGNQTANQLYVNEGDFSFKNVSEAAGVAVADRWSTGVSMVDINADGWLDIYVCAAGTPSNPAQRKNQAFINQKDGTFVDEAEKLGIADAGHTTQAYFWDFDKDNDLDLYVVNHRVDFKNNTKIDSEIARDIKPETSDQLYENVGGTFKNITAKAGISNKAWGLSASIADFNADGWPDIYVACDFLEPDMLYLNQKDGTFKEASKEVFKHISFYGMGSDVADINNDGLLDLYVLDMVSEDHIRSKRNMASMSNSNFWSMVRYGYHYQYMLNTLQLNNGNGSYSEISNMAGTAKTDWSWAPLIADFNQDGYQDIFVTNGIKRDVTDNDFKTRAQKVIDAGEQLTADRALALMTSTKISNYAFKNNGDLTFSKSQKRWGLDQSQNSNGAAYADLDNDGDLDLIVNNMDATASIYRNSSNKKSIQIKLNGPNSNKNGIGARVEFEVDNETYAREVYPSRGFMSASTGDMLIYAPTSPKSATITWSDGKKETKQVNGNTIAFNYTDATSESNANSATTLFVNAPSNLGINYQHRENAFDDFKKEILMPHRQSQFGPAFCTGDFNNDGKEDIFYGAAKGGGRSIYFQGKNGFSAKPFMSAPVKEDVAATAFDANGDGLLDIYIVCGGNESPTRSKNYDDELWINSGKGQFRPASNVPKFRVSGRCVTTADIDGDGDQDMFVGGGAIPQFYPEAERSYLLINEKGKFIDKTPDHLKKPGIVATATFADMDDDGDDDLLISGEWMPVLFYENENGSFKAPQDLTNENGWIFQLATHDIDNNGKLDILVGNVGKNNKFHPSSDRPLHLYFADFDNNGQKDIVLSKDKGDHELPVRGRECTSQQMPYIQDKFPTYQEFAEADLNEIYGKKLDEAYHLQAHDFAHFVLLQGNNGKFTKKSMPNSTQRGPIMSMQPITIDNETFVAFGGNFYPTEVETMRYDGSIGGLLTWKDDALEVMPATSSGIYLNNDIRNIAVVSLNNQKQAIITASNNDKPLVYVTK